MGEKAVSFYRKNKSLGNSPIPFFECLCLRHPIKGIIDLHCCEIPQIMPQLVACWDPLRIKCTYPMLVVPAGRPHVYFTLHATVLFGTSLLRPNLCHAEHPKNSASSTLNRPKNIIYCTAVQKPHI